MAYFQNKNSFASAFTLTSILALSLSLASAPIGTVEDNTPSAAEVAAAIGTVATVTDIPSLYSIIGVGPAHQSLDEIITTLGNMRIPLEEMLALNPNWIMLSTIEGLEKLRDQKEEDKVRALPELMEKGLFAIHFHQSITSTAYNNIASFFDLLTELAPAPKFRKAKPKPFTTLPGITPQKIKVLIALQQDRGCDLTELFFKDDPAIETALHAFREKIISHARAKIGESDFLFTKRQSENCKSLSESASLFGIYNGVGPTNVKGGFPHVMIEHAQTIPKDKEQYALFRAAERLEPVYSARNAMQFYSPGNYLDDAMRLISKVIVTLKDEEFILNTVRIALNFFEISTRRYPKQLLQFFDP